MGRPKGPPLHVRKKEASSRRASHALTALRTRDYTSPRKIQPARGHAKAVRIGRGPATVNRPALRVPDDASRTSTGPHDTRAGKDRVIVPLEFLMDDTRAAPPSGTSPEADSQETCPGRTSRARARGIAGTLREKGCGA